MSELAAGDDASSKVYRREITKAVLYFEEKENVRVEEKIIVDIINAATEEDPFFVIALLIKTRKAADLLGFFKRTMERIRRSDDLSGPRGDLNVNMRQVAAIVHELESKGSEDFKKNMLALMSEIPSL